MPRPSDRAVRRPSRHQRLARLRDLLHHACDLAEPMTFFLDHLARDPVFCRRSAAGDPGLDPILQSIAVSVFGPGGAPGERSFRRYGPLWHGRCVFASGEASVLYHAGVDVGVVDMPLDGGRAFLRFTTRTWKMWAAAEQPSG
jgi:hypothetical protein